MAEPVEIPLGKREARAKSPFVSSQSLINGFVEIDPEQGPSIYKGPGLTQFADCANGAIRGMLELGDNALAVSGDALYTVNSSGTATAIGAISGYDPVVMASNGSQVAIVSDATSYVFNGTTLTPINDPDFLRAYSVDFLRQTMIFSKYDSGVFFTSEIADAEAYDALDKATAEFKPDKLLRVFSVGNNVLMMGEKSVEEYYYSGKPNGVPLSPTQTVLDYGIAGRDAVALVDNTAAWLAHDGTVRTLREASPIAVADPAITAQIQRWTDISLTRAFTLTGGGHEWLVLRNPSGCLWWDATTQLWSARQSYSSSTWRGVCGLFKFKKQLVGDADTGKIWQMSESVHAEGSDPLVCSIISRTMGPGGRPFTLEAIELECEPGVGLATGQGSDPKVYLQLSRDSGVTYGARMERSLGASGNRNVRVRWQGPFGDFPPHGGVIKFGISDPVRFVATRMWAEFTPNSP